MGIELMLADIEADALTKKINKKTRTNSQSNDNYINI